uniref:F-box protein AT5G49610-like beta-propeller domain-containing protein n=2 Tax=Aegilops tauschii subsp. strangulata TaxID=200361 RepID=A0A453DG27_AEGTS
EMATEKVLSNDNLLEEILLRLDLPTCLVRASLACSRWLCAVSRPAFLRRFRRLHAPRLLGFYVVGDGVPRQDFVPVPSPPELAAVLRRASSGLDAYSDFSFTIDDCRNGRLLVDGYRVGGTQVVSPLLHRQHHLAPALVLPPPPPASLDGVSHGYTFLPEDGGDGASYHRVDLEHHGRQVSAQVSTLGSGAWTVQIAKAELPEPPDRIPDLTVLLRGKLYMVTTAGYILGLDLAAASFFVVQLPDGVTYQYFGSLVLSRGYDDHHHDGDHLYLFHVVDRFQLQVWRRRPWTTAADDEAQWVLVHSICLRKACGHLVQQTLVGFSVVGVGDNAEFAFLEEDSGAFVLLWLGSRTVEKVYQRDPDNDELIIVYPVTMVWPPVFPPHQASRAKFRNLEEAEQS